MKEFYVIQNKQVEKKNGRSKTEDEKDKLLTGCEPKLLDDAIVYNNRRLNETIVFHCK